VRGGLTIFTRRVAKKVPVPVEDVAKSILFLASESWSRSIMGQVLAIDSGKQGKLLWLKEECPEE
jgi:enoyl-[acyl-carrier-protein] reductase (NADH)